MEVSLARARSPLWNSARVLSRTGDVAFSRVSAFVGGVDDGFFCHLDDDQCFSVSEELGRVFFDELEVDGDDISDGRSAGVCLD